MCKRPRERRNKRKCLSSHLKREQSSILTYFTTCVTTSSSSSLRTLDDDAIAAATSSPVKNKNKKLKNYDDKMDSEDDKKTNLYYGSISAAAATAVTAVLPVGSSDHGSSSSSSSSNNSSNSSDCGGQDSTIKEFVREITTNTYASTFPNTTLTALPALSNLDKGRTENLPNQYHLTQQPLLPNHSISSSSYENYHTQRRHRLLESKKAWRNVLHGRGPPAPRCKSHNLICLLRTVLKKGPNKGRRFYVCPLPNGAPGQKGARCNYFTWATASGKPLLAKKHTNTTTWETQWHVRRFADETLNSVIAWTYVCVVFS